MAEKEPIIVIKKITVAPAGGHGGSWKVAFADFMTAMMSFFLLMWLLSQNDEVKQNVADYFSTPSIIEYNFSNYGVELTLEKLFLDLINEPLKFFQAFMTPADMTPNLMAMGSKKIIIHELAEQLGDLATNVEVHSDEFSFEIPDHVLFKPGTGDPSAQFVEVMEKVKGITRGLEDSDIFIDSKLYQESVRERNLTLAKQVGEKRVDLVARKIEVGLEHDSVDIYSKVTATKYSQPVRSGDFAPGLIKIRIKQKDSLDGPRKPRKLDEAFGSKDSSMSVYDNFVNQLSK